MNIYRCRYVYDKQSPSQITETDMNNLLKILSTRPNITQLKVQNVVKHTPKRRNE